MRVEAPYPPGERQDDYIDTHGPEAVEGRLFLVGGGTFRFLTAILGVRVVFWVKIGFGTRFMPYTSLRFVCECTVNVKQQFRARGLLTSIPIINSSSSPSETG